MAKGALVAAGALLIAAGGAGIGYALTRKPTGGMSPEVQAAMASAAARLDGDVTAARTAVHERAMTLAALQQVQAAVSTDMATARDMRERGELKFDPQQGEVIEIGQVRKDGSRVALLVEPDGGAAGWPGYAEHAGKLGSYVDFAGPAAKKLVLMEVVDVKAREESAMVMGYLSVARPFDLGPTLDKLGASGVGGKLEVLGEPIEFGKAPADFTPQTMAVPSLAKTQLVVYAAKRKSGTPVPIAAGGGGAAFVGLLLVAIGMMKKAGQGALPAAQIGSSGPQTQLTGSGVGTLGGVGAAGTPVPPGMSGPISANDLGAGAMIGRWEVVKRLGSGGMADVFLARAKGEAGFEKLVALKVMHPHLARNERAVQHFLDEARLAARVEHPNVVQIQDLGKIGNDYVIVMEFVEGVDLERILLGARAAQRQVPINVALGIVCRICDGLNAAHRATAPDGTPLNIVHRDVKSANVLVSKQGAVKVVDFGIAKAAKQGHLTMAGETKGTPSMMAPEQRVGEVVDVRADVYSTAAVAYELVTGAGVNLDLAALAHLGTDNWPHLPPPTQLRPQLPPELDQLLLTSMSFDRERRPADCAAFESLLEGIMKQHNLTATDKDIARWVASELQLLGTMATSTQSAAPPIG